MHSTAPPQKIKPSNLFSSLFQPDRRKTPRRCCNGPSTFSAIGTTSNCTKPFVRSTRTIIIFFWLIFMCGACKKTSSHYPKPRGFHRIELPPPTYYQLSGDYPYQFSLSVRAVVLPDTSTISEPYWIVINYPQTEASISISYKKVPNYDSLAAYVNTSSRLTHKHNIRSSHITDYPIRTPRGYGGVVSELGGEVPSHMQFWLTDSTQHFLRAALYFPSSQKSDSLAPAIAYMKGEMSEIINTLEFRYKR